MTNQPAAAQIPVTGTELALLVAGTFALENWPFERQAARAIATPRARRAVSSVEEKVFDQAKALWDQHGVWESDAKFWTRDLIRRRASVRGSISLTPDELRSVVTGLRACVAEFSDDWGEFCVAIPGKLECYEVGPEHLSKLADRLETVFA